MASRVFWDRIADRYAGQPVSDQASYEKKLALTRDYFNPSMQVLEIGCGTGSTAIAHAPYVRQIHAVDLSGRMIEIAREKAAAAGVGNISFECTTAEALDLPGASVDAVLGMSVLHLLDDPGATVTAVHALLKPGGLFFSSTACIGDMGWIFRLIAPVMKILPFLPTVQVFTVRDLEETIKEAGFDIEYQWQPGKDKAVFIVARKPLEAA